MRWILLLTFTYQASAMWISRTWPFKLNLISERVAEARLSGISHYAGWVWKGLRGHIQKEHIYLPCCVHVDTTQQISITNSKESLRVVILRTLTYSKLFCAGLKYECHFTFSPTRWPPVTVVITVNAKLLKGICVRICEKDLSKNP